MSGTRSSAMGGSSFMLPMSADRRAMCVATACALMRSAAEKRDWLRIGLAKKACAICSSCSTGQISATTFSPYRPRWTCEMRRDEAR